ncbi:MAG TPA: PAS domain-containing sensor histidine kinase [Candidatus Limivicinus faecipullorum]|nr:PAS domain-containing sensor histidine kinase [Candidatus Limivicinus faecipullorum]
MTKRIFQSICIAAVTVLLASLVLIMGVLYDYFSRVQKEQLSAQADLAARGAADLGMEYFEGLDLGGCRISWIAADGSVLYDNMSDAESMENHLDREEVREAMETGRGESSRYSDTLTEKLSYQARLLPDGTVIRLAASQYTAWVLLMGVLQPLLVVVLLAVLLSLLLAYRLSARLVKPLNEVDLSDPLKKVEYEELRPLLSRIDSQHRQLKRDREELEKNEEIRREFTANVSHELKTPLHSISGYAELLAKGMVRPEDVEKFSSKIYSESQRMTSLVEDIIELSHLDTGAGDMKREDVDLYLIARTAADSLSMAAKEAGVELKVSGESARVYGVPQLLYGICYNLCDNGIKYNREKGRVEISVRNLEGEVELKVSDTGIGIPEESRERIFERFYRVDKSRSKAVGGTGLGLSIVKHAALVHRATIDIDSEPGSGTSFTLHFPKDTQERKVNDISGNKEQ